jgi:ankyrin repeat protein
MSARFHELESYVADLSEDERRALCARAFEHEHGVFDLIRAGDAAGLHAAVQQDPAILERRDESGMTPLHWAAYDSSGFLFEVMTREPSSAPWARDNAGRLPLDVLRDAGQHGIADKAERLTYPQLFRDEKGGPVEPEKIAAFEAKCEALGRPDTSPSYARNPEPLAKQPASLSHGRNMDERER